MEPTRELSTTLLPSTAAAAAEPPGEPRYLLRAEHPQISFTSSSALVSDRPKPDVLKLRKRVHAWPLEFTFKADYHTESRQFCYGLMCRDSLVKGHVTLSIPRQQIEYSKRLPLGGVAGGAVLALNASARLEDRTVKPDFRFTVEFGTHSPRGDGSAVYVAGPDGGSSFDLQQRFRVAKGLALEVCGNVRLPSPAARYSPQSGQLMLGEGAFQLHLAQVNAVVHM